MAEKTRFPTRILRRKEVEGRTGLSRSTIYARINPKSACYDAHFPKPIELGTGMLNPPVGWLESEVEAWLATQVEKSRPLIHEAYKKAIKASSTTEADVLNDVFLFAKHRI